MARLEVTDRPYPLLMSAGDPEVPEAVGPDPESMEVRLQTGEAIHYLEWSGAGHPGRPLLLVHGLMRTGWTWLPVGRRLAAAGLHVVAPDLRGHGASDAPLYGYELGSLALDQLTVAAGAGWGEAVGGPPLVVAGHGLGAMIAVEMARLQPSSVAAVALLDSGWEEMVEATRMLPDQLVDAMREPPEVLVSMEAYLADRRAFDPATWDADQEHAARAQVSVRHAGHVGPVTRGSVVRRCVEAMYAYRPLEVLAQVRCPLTLLVASPGTADDEDERERQLAIADAQRVRTAAGLGSMTVRVFDGVGHDLMRYRPEAVAHELGQLAGA
jgi:pimeloyl-ACP methyl ester carboxylesterase